MGEPVLAEGMADYLAAARRPAGLPLEAARLAADRDAARLAYPRPRGMQVITTFVAAPGRETPVRVYRSAHAHRSAVVYLHGGGFTTGSVESYDSLATALAGATGAVVLSVHYRRLPEATPAAILDEGHDVLRWVERQADALAIDPARIALAGDSAGAFLAAHLAAEARDRGSPAIACQLLCYGVFDLDPRRPGYRTSRDPVFGPALIDAVIAAYRDADARASRPVPPPLHLADLSSMPPTVVLGAEHDPMLGEGREFAARLRAAGVKVEERVAPAMCHGFLRAVRFSAAARAEMRWLAAAARPWLQGE